MSMHHLIIAGVGIKFISQITIEVMEYIKKAKKLLFLVNDPAIEAWLIKTNPSAESLNEIYFKHENRIDAYEEIKNKILKDLDNNELVCVIFYGHPTVYCEPGLQAALAAEKLGHHVVILPAISTFDCIFSDLKIDLITAGLSSYETTQFLIYKIKPSIKNHLLLWQVATTGNLKIVKEKNMDGCRKKILQEYLLQFYPKEHKVILYVASQYPHLPPYIDSIPLSNLKKTPIHQLGTLYIPPLKKRRYARNVIESLENNKLF